MCASDQLKKRKFNNHFNQLLQWWLVYLIYIMWCFQLHELCSKLLSANILNFVQWFQDHAVISKLKGLQDTFVRRCIQNDVSSLKCSTAMLKLHIVFITLTSYSGTCYKRKYLKFIFWRLCCIDKLRIFCSV